MAAILFFKMAAILTIFPNIFSRFHLPMLSLQPNSYFYDPYTTYNM